MEVCQLQPALRHLSVVQLDALFCLDDLSIDGVKVVQYIVQLIRECQRFSRWKDNLSVSIKILDNLALSAAFQAFGGNAYS